jgi:cyanophycin synthetase
MIAHILTLAGHHVGVATADGIAIDGVRILRGDMSGPDSARIVLRNPAIDAAVLETSHKGILCCGLGYDRADVAVITNVSGESVSAPAIGSHDLVRLNAVVANSTGEHGVTVLNADDHECVRIAGETHGEVIYFSRQPVNEVIGRHLRLGGRALILRTQSDRQILTLIDSSETQVLLARGTSHGSNHRDEVTMSSALAAASASVGLGIDLECIGLGLRAFFEAEQT